jgi:rubrerythrin
MEHTLINGCIKAESAAASIYGNLSNIFPEQKEFWETMRDDEREHISFLNDVKSLGLISEIDKMDLLPPMELINKSLKIADDVSDEITVRPVSFEDALSMTLKLEESMAETYTNKLIARLLSCEGETSFEKLVADEKNHINKIKNIIKKKY